MVKETATVETRDSTTKKIAATGASVVLIDTTQTESIEEQQVQIHFADNGGVIEVLPSGVVRMQGVTAANGVYRGLTAEKRGQSVNARQDSVSVDSVGSREGLQHWSYEKEKKQPPDGLQLLGCIALLALIVFVVWKWANPFRK